jgi:hypothetical protein
MELCRLVSSSFFLTIFGNAISTIFRGQNKEKGMVSLVWDMTKKDIVEYSIGTFFGGGCNFV